MNAPQIVCEEWYSVKKIFDYNKWVITCENKNKGWSWIFYSYDLEWNKKSKWFYKNDKPDWKREYYKDWIVNEYMNYSNGVLDWEYKTNSYVWNYISGFRVWEWKEYYEWKLRAEYSYENWLCTWLYVYYYDSWVKLSESMFMSWRANWLYTWYYPDWKLQETGIKKWWYKEGNWYLYNELWRVETIQTYRNWIKIHEEPFLKLDSWESDDDWFELEIYNEKAFSELSLLLSGLQTKGHLCLSEYIMEWNIEITHDEWEEWCKETKNYLETVQEDNYWVVKTLNDIVDWWLEYNEISRKTDATFFIEWTINDHWDNIFDDEHKVIHDLSENYKKLGAIFDRISNFDFVYIPNKFIYQWVLSIHIIFNEEEAKQILDNLGWSWFVADVNSDLKLVEKLSDNLVENDYMRLVKLVGPCLQENLVAWHTRIKYDTWIKQCNYVKSQLDVVEICDELLWLKNTLSRLSANWAEFLDINKKSWELANEQAIEMPNWDIIYPNQPVNPRKDELIDEIKTNYKMLLKYTQVLPQNNWFMPVDNFYVSKDIMDNSTFRYSADL